MQVKSTSKASVQTGSQQCCDAYQSTSPVNLQQERHSADVCLSCIARPQCTNARPARLSSRRPFGLHMEQKLFSILRRLNLYQKRKLLYSESLISETSGDSKNMFPCQEDVLETSNVQACMGGCVCGGGLCVCVCVCVSDTVALWCCRVSAGCCQSCMTRRRCTSGRPARLPLRRPSGCQWSRCLRASTTAPLPLAALLRCAPSPCCSAPSLVV